MRAPQTATSMSRPAWVTKPVSLGLTPNLLIQTKPPPPPAPPPP